jgi:hypothetical protein
MSVLALLWQSLLGTLRDILPILTVLGFFQLAILRKPLPNPGRLIWGITFVVVGLAVFLSGLQLALFPLGESMADQLTAVQVKSLEATASAFEPDPPIEWQDFYWVYVFAFAIGISTTVAEPSLIAVSIKAQEVSGGTIRAIGLRLAVALGVGLGVALGSYRIVVGIPLSYFILSGYLLVVLQTTFAPRQIVPLAYDSGGVTTSTVTVPLVAALGVGLATRVPGREPMIDGFGLIAFASLFPMLTVMGYAQLSQMNQWIRQRRLRRQTEQADSLDEDLQFNNQSSIGT